MNDEHEKLVKARDETYRQWVEADLQRAKADLQEDEAYRSWIKADLLLNDYDRMLAARERKES